MPFFQDGYTSEYGRFFLNWYFGALKTHAAEVLSRAHAVFNRHGVSIAGKVAGIHWWYKSQTHAAEVTAGYYNTNGCNAYEEIAQVFAAHGATLYFTCLEMVDSQQSSSCDSGPQELVAQVGQATRAEGIKFSGENALPRYDWAAYAQILSYRSELADFTYLRLNNQLLESGNFGRFKAFVKDMHGYSSLVV